MAATVALTALFVACHGGSVAPPSAALPTPPGGIAARDKITHVVVISEENRTYDDIFGGGFSGGPPIYLGGDGAIPSDIASEIKPGGFNTDVAYNAHDYYRCLQVNNFSATTWGNMKAGVWTQSPQPCPTTGPPYNPDAFAHADRAALTIIDGVHRATYTALANEFEISDAYYAIQDADSFAGHQFIVALRSRNDLGELISGTPTRGGELMSCGSAVGTNDVQTPVLNRTNGFTTWQYEGDTGVCWNGPTFGDALDAAHVSWRHYSTDNTGVFNGFINFRSWYPLTDPNLPGSHFRISINDLYNDINAGDLPQFTWVKPPCIALSDHPGVSHDPFGGSDWVASVVNKIGANQALWQHTVIFVVWDDWGGFYDHKIPPQPGIGLDDGLTPGMRQPFIVISPYDRTPGGVNHDFTTYASVLHFTEELYGIAPLNTLDAYANDLGSFFDFSKQYTPFVSIPYAEPQFDVNTACATYHGIAPYEIDR